MPRPAPPRPARETLAAMRDEKMPVTDIARVFGVRVETVRQWLNDYGFPSFLKRPPMPPRDELEALREQGLGLGPIAARYGVNHCTVANWLKRYGLPAQVERRPSASRPPTPKDVAPPPKPIVATQPRRRVPIPPRDELAALRDQGWSLALISKHYHVRDERVGEWLDTYGLPRQRTLADRGPDRDTLIQLRDEGKSRQEIANLYGISLAALTILIREYKLPRAMGGSPSRSPGRETLAALVADGKTTKDIAAQYGVQPCAAREWLRNAGLRAGRGTPQSPGTVAPRKETRSCPTPKRTKSQPAPTAAARSTGNAATRSTATSATSSTSTTSNRARRAPHPKDGSPLCGVTAMAASTPALTATSPFTPTLSEFRDGLQRARERRDEEMRRLQAAYRPLAFRIATKPVCTTPPALRAELDALAEQMHAEAAPSPYAAERTPEQRRAVSGLARTW